MEVKKPHRIRYEDLRAVLEKDIGKEYADTFSEQDLIDFGDLLIACTKAYFR